MSVIRELRKAACGLWSLIVGLKITGDAFFRKQITVHYPRRTVTNLDTFRGHIELVGKDEKPDTPRCIACFKCARVCPSGCISLECAKDRKSAMKKATDNSPLAHDPNFSVTPRKADIPEKSVRTPALFHLDFNYCSLCGLCVQSCPVGSLRFSKDAYLASFDKHDFEYDLLARLQTQAGQPAHAEPEGQ